MPLSKSLNAGVFRHFSSVPRLRNLSKIPPWQRPRAVKEARQALIDYLHFTRLVPFAYAEYISKHALVSLSQLIASVDFSPSDFSKSLKKFLRYHPINELEFFYESIGIDYNEVQRFLPRDKFFFCEDGRAFSAATALSTFGFPWNKLGLLYKAERSIFSKDSEELASRLSVFMDCGFSNVAVVGICLAFPCLLNGEFGDLLDDLKKVFFDFDLVSYVEENVDAWYEICTKIRVFYDLGLDKGKVGELIGKSKSIFVDHPLDVVVQKADYFCKFGVEKKCVGMLLLQRPEIFNFDLLTPEISIKGFLKHFGLSEKELKSVGQKYPHVMGKNKMINLPHVFRALDLHVWAFNKIMQGNHLILASYAMSDSNGDLDKEYRDSLARIQASRYSVHIMTKLDFMHGIGFGQNSLTIKALTHIHGCSSELKERFDSLLHTGINFSKLCMMIKRAPKILNQKPETLVQKVSYLCQETGHSFQYLYLFPAFLCFDLENRIRPRYSFHMWITEKGLCAKHYSIASVVATSEKQFIARIYGIHPAALKHWFECFLPRKSN
uniref:Uncharacterized protein n=1 Tax=Rhizophora mucronata TaxID=61149 RepID=A0A2P2PJZ8_RHIMU